ncbi:MAG TPA: serine O-acetyltransferase, partial [Stellaceae bacterium]
MTKIDFPVQDVAAPQGHSVPTSEGELWELLRADAAHAAESEAMLRGFLDLAVLRHAGFASALAVLLAGKLAERFMPAERLEDLARGAMADGPGIIAAAIADLVAIRSRDPAADSYLTPFLYYKGFHALEWHRVGHWLWRG